MRAISQFSVAILYLAKIAVSLEIASFSNGVIQDGTKDLELSALQEAQVQDLIPDFSTWSYSMNSDTESSEKPISSAEFYNNSDSSLLYSLNVSQSILRYESDNGTNYFLELETIKKAYEERFGANDKGDLVSRSLELQDNFDFQPPLLFVSDNGTVVFPNQTEVSSTLQKRNADDAFTYGQLAAGVTIAVYLGGAGFARAYARTEGNNTWRRLINTFPNWGDGVAHVLHTFWMTAYHGVSELSGRSSNGAEVNADTFMITSEQVHDELKKRSLRYPGPGIKSVWCSGGNTWDFNTLTGIMNFISNLSNHLLKESVGPVGIKVEWIDINTRQSWWYFSTVIIPELFDFTNDWEDCGVVAGQHF